MSEDINVVVKMPNEENYIIKINADASVQDALEKLITDTSIIVNRDVDKSLFLYCELNQGKHLNASKGQFLKQNPSSTYEFAPADFATTKIKDLITKSESSEPIVTLKFKVPDESTNFYDGINKNQIKLKDFIPPELLNFTEFEKIKDEASLLEFCQEKNKQKVKSYEDYSEAQKAIFWDTIINKIVYSENKKLSLETVFEFHIFIYGNKKIQFDDFYGELANYTSDDENYDGIFLFSEYLNIEGYCDVGGKDQIKSMNPIFDFINQHKTKHGDRDNTLNYINLIDFFGKMCDKKFAWQDILDLKLIDFENADDFKKLDSDGLSSIINTLRRCLSKNSKDQKAIETIKNIFANIANSVAKMVQIIKLLNLCKQHDIDIEMDENTVTKLFREIEEKKCQLKKDELLKICSFCKDNSIPEESMKYVIEKCPSSDLLTPTFINYVKRKTKFNAGSDFNSVHSLAMYDIGGIYKSYYNNKKISYTKDDFIGLFSFIDRKGLCVNVLGIEAYQSYRECKSFGDMKNFAISILNAKNTPNQFENEIIQNNKLTLAELHVIFFSDFSFDNESYDVTEQQFKNMIPDEIDFGYLKFLLLFYSERNKLTNENIIFCFEKYKIGIDKNLDDLFKYLDDNYIKMYNEDDNDDYFPKTYIKMLDQDKKNDLVCKLFDVYIKNRKIQPDSDDFNKAEEAKNKYLMKECLKTTTTEKENQQTIIYANKNDEIDSEADNKIKNKNTYNQNGLSEKNQYPINTNGFQKIDNGIKNNNSQNESDSKSSNADDSSSMTTLKIIGHIFTLGIFIWGPLLFNAIFGGCCSCIKTYDESEGNSLIDSTEKNNRSEGRDEDKSEENLGKKNDDYL